VDTLARLRELDSPVYRWPGGNFVSGYDWKDGIGDRDRRPPRNVGRDPASLPVGGEFGVATFAHDALSSHAEPVSGPRPA